jgi:enoyl-CoA hydratase
MFLQEGKALYSAESGVGRHVDLTRPRGLPGPAAWGLWHRQDCCRGLVRLGADGVVGARRRFDGRELAALISLETRGHVAVVQMAHGKANALDTTLCRELAAQLAGLERSGHRAAVLIGQGPIFSAGVDLLRLRDGGPGYLEEFLSALSEAFLALFTCPVPVVAAVNGHAVAGGCILVCACDYRVMDAGHGRIGVTELLVGLPFPVTALEILRFAVGTHRLQELTHFGRTYPASEAVGLGLVDEAVAGASVLARAVAIADQFAALAPEPLLHTRRQIRGPVLDRIRQQRASDHLVRRMWDSPARETVAEYVQKTLRN